MIQVVARPWSRSKLERSCRRARDGSAAFASAPGVTERISAMFQLRTAEKTASAPASIEGPILRRPFVLIEGLDHVIVLGQRLAQAEGEHRFAISQVADDFASAPFSGRGWLFGSLGADRAEQRFQLLCGAGDHVQRILLS